MWVDGLIASGANFNPEKVVIKPKQPPKIVIHGNIENLVALKYDSEIEVKGNVGNFCDIRSEYNGFTAKNIGEGTLITVRNKIKVAIVEKDCILNSKQYGLEAIELQNNVTVEVRDAINISGNIGSGCNIKSSNYGLKALNVSENTTITTRDAIHLRNIGSNSSITSTNYGLNADNAGLNVIIKTRDAIRLNKADNGCKIECSNYGIDVTSSIGNNVTIKARDNIAVGAVGSNCELTSSNGKIKVVGNSGENVTIEARDAIQIRDIGRNSNIVSTNDEVRVDNIGNWVTITARDDIDVGGICPQDAVLKSQKGKVRKAPQPLQTPIIIKEKISSSYETAYENGKYESDLQHAIELSKAELLNKKGIFSSKVVSVNVEDDDLVPDAYKCPITLEIMKNPVICFLDGKTYEESAIRTWLNEKGTSPTNRKPLTVNQSIDDVLIVNYNLKVSV